MLRFFREKAKAIFVVIAVIFAATMFYGLGYKGLKGVNTKSSSKSEGIAKVNGKEIDGFRFSQMVNRMVSETKGNIDPVTLLYMQGMALNQVVDFTVMQQEAERHFGASGDEVRKAISDIMTSNKIPNESTFDKALRTQGFSLDNLRRTIKDEITVQRMVSQIKNDATVTPDDLREVRAQHILIRPKDESGKSNDDARKLAEDILKMAKSGQDFSELAKKYSMDPGNAKNGGDLGFFKKGSMVKEFDDAVFALKPGQVSNLVKTQFGYHIIKMNESRLMQNVNKDQMLTQKKDNVFKGLLLFGSST